MQKSHGLLFFALLLATPNWLFAAAKTCEQSLLEPVENLVRLASQSLELVPQICRKARANFFKAGLSASTLRLMI